MIRYIISRFLSRLENGMTSRLSLISYVATSLFEVDTYVIHISKAFKKQTNNKV